MASLKEPIVLAHGLFGFSRIGVGPITLTSYFRRIPEALREAGNQVIVTRVPPIASVEERAHRLAEHIDYALPTGKFHFIGHSMGGLDARRLLTDPAWRRRTLSLTTIGTPHLGSSIADFAKLRVGRVFRLLTTLGIDPAGCLDVTRKAARRAHRLLEPPKDLFCTSIAGAPTHDSVSWPLKRLHAVLEEMEGPNDGLVSVESALAFGTPLEPWPVDHLQQMNWLVPGDPGSDHSPIFDLYASIVQRLLSAGFEGTLHPPADNPPTILSIPVDREDIAKRDIAK